MIKHVPLLPYIYDFICKVALTPTLLTGVNNITVLYIIALTALTKKVDNKCHCCYSTPA